jgi:hypothetical protein
MVIVFLPGAARACRPSGLAAGRKGALAVMNTSLSYSGFGPTARDQAHTLFGQTMAYVAATAGLTMFDFQRLRRATELDSAPLIAASIFLDVLNVFLFFLRIFSRNN